MFNEKQEEKVREMVHEFAEATGKNESLVYDGFVDFEGRVERMAKEVVHLMEKYAADAPAPIEKDAERMDWTGYALAFIPVMMMRVLDSIDRPQRGMVAAEVCEAIGKDYRKAFMAKAFTLIGEKLKFPG